MNYVTEGTSLVTSITVVCMELHENIQNGLGENGNSKKKMTGIQKRRLFVELPNIVYFFPFFHSFHKISALWFLNSTNGSNHGNSFG